MMIQTIAVTLAPLFLSFLASSRPGVSYQALSKPSWTPPPLAFPIVWTVLYLLMGYASSRVLRTEGWLSWPVALYVVQLVLNISWTPLFFGQGNYVGALWLLRALVVVVVATAVLFWRADTTAGLLLLPYLAWLMVAHALNQEIVRLNPVERGKNNVDSEEERE